MPIPLRLSFGAWWLAEKGALDHELMYGGFEKPELRFVRRILRPGMRVLDIGAHHGSYTLFASKCVGRKGRVIALEPPPREFRRLARHVRVNRRTNILLEPCALGNESGEANFFHLDGFRDWGNTLLLPVVPEPTHKIRVPIRELDDPLEAQRISHVDFIKLDSEGAELSASKAPENFSKPRSAVLAEVEDPRTQPRGYKAREILHRLALWNYRWFALTDSGMLYAASLEEEAYDANFVALPHQRLAEFQPLIGTE